MVSGSHLNRALLKSVLLRSAALWVNYSVNGNAAASNLVRMDREVRVEFAGGAGKGAVVVVAPCCSGAVGVDDEG